MNENKEIDKTSHYFILMHPLEKFFIPGFGAICYTSSNTREKWVECKIVEDRYKISDGYKVELKSIEEGYGRERFYIDDFISNLNAEYIVKKDSPDLCCIEENWIEPLTSNTYLYHSAYTLKKVKNNK